MSASSRISDYISSIPIATRSLLFINVSVHIALFFFTSENGGFRYSLAISPYRVIYFHEIYRIITSAFVHGGILHIAMNMSSLMHLGLVLENNYGTTKFLFLTAWSLVLTGTLYVSMSWYVATN
jgi:rhomboid protease GluP